MKKPNDEQKQKKADKERKERVDEQEAKGKNKERTDGLFFRIPLLSVHRFQGLQMFRLRFTFIVHTSRLLSPGRKVHLNCMQLVRVYSNLVHEGIIEISMSSLREYSTQL